MAAKNMLIYSTDWYGSRTFRMLPITEDCPYNEVIYDPNTKVLAVISKEFKEKPHMFPKLNTAGSPLPSKNPEKEYVEERLIMDTYYEYYIDNIDDIKMFVNYFAINNHHESVKVLEESVSAEV